jgi:uncharacterized membrane protein YdbT with pleckstrin-like domain
MPTITCDRCEKPIEVPNPIIGQRVTCPSCGDVNVIRSLSNSPAPSTDRAAAAGYPPALGPEQDVLIVRPAMFRARPFRFLLLMVVFLGGIAGAIASIAIPPLAIACGVVAVAALIWLIVWKIHTLGEGLRITTKRTIDRHGLLSKETSDVLHVDIKNIQIRQSFLDRLWGVGSIALSSSAEHEDEIEINNVPHPEKVREIIDLYRQL